MYGAARSSAFPIPRLLLGLPKLTRRALRILKLGSILTLGRITISTITTTSYDTLQIEIVPETTAFATATATKGEVVLKRQDKASNVPYIVAPIPIAATATADGPIATDFIGIAQNASIAGVAYNACSCLRLTSSTITTAPTIVLVRTLSS